MDGNPSPLEILIWIAIVLLAVGYLTGAWRRRHIAAHSLKWVSVAVFVCCIEFLIFQSNGGVDATAWFCIALTGFVIWKIRPADLPTRIPVTTRRRVIDRWERKTGNKFNSRKYDIDHVVPYSRGGGHTAENLRVMEKGKNRSKGARIPWWDVLGKIQNIISRR